MSSSDCPSPTTISQATRITPKTSHTYAANFSPDWCIGSVPHGGYVTCCFQEVAALHFSSTLVAQNQPHCMTLHLEFVRRTSVGPALFTVRDVKVGRQTSTISVSLWQRDGSSQGREEVVGYLTHSNLDTESGVSFDTAWSLKDPAPPPIDFAACDAGSDPNWSHVSVLPFSDFRQASKRVRWIVPKAPITALGFTDQWISLKDGGERFTNARLGFVVDMFTQVVETFLKPDAYAPGGESDDDGSRRKRNPAARFWYPTVVLNLEVKKALPPEGVEWLFIRARTKSIKNGKYDLDIVVLDAQEDLVCSSHHVCLALSAQRNLQERRRQGANLPAQKL